MSTFKKVFVLNVLLGMLFYVALAFVVPPEGLGAGDWELKYNVGTNFAYYFDDHAGGVNEGGFLPPNYSPLNPADSSLWLNSPLGNKLETSPDTTRKLGSGWGAVEIEFFYQFSAKTLFLTGDGSFTENNSLEFSLKPYITPVSAHLESRAYFTPIAFLVLIAGFDLGTGWRLNVLNLEGLSLNNTDSIAETARGGLYSSVYLAGRLQFDFEAVFPGEYNHVILVAEVGLKYKNNSNAGADDAWYWRADGGRNFNGWEYDGDYLLGWLPPRGKVKFVGFRMEHNANISDNVREMSKVADGGWGSDFHSLRFGPLMNWSLGENHSLTVLVQFHNGVYYDEETSYARWFQRRKATGETYVEFQRLALAYTWKL